jgi:small subunit ribosomal protein S11e
MVLAGKPYTDKYNECDQHEKAYQKQDAVFVSKKRVIGAKKGKSMRYVKNIGLGFKTPKLAIDGNYVDKKCPFTGNVSIRGRILKGLVISAGKMKNTIVVRRDYLHYISKYRRFEKRHTNMSVHASPAFGILKEGDVVTVGQCRPLAKTVKFNVVDCEPNTNTALNVKKLFRVF